MVKFNLLRSRIDRPLIVSGPACGRPHAVVFVAWLAQTGDELRRLLIVTVRSGPGVDSLRPAGPGA